MKVSRIFAVSVLSAMLAACNGSDGLPAPLAKLFGQEQAASQPQASAVQAASAAAASAPANIHDAFTASCVNSALQGRPDVAEKPENRALAGSICQCVYDEGIKAYGGKAQWESAIAHFDKPETVDARLQKTVDTAIPMCIKKHVSPDAASGIPSAFASNPAAASAASAAAQK